MVGFRPLGDLGLVVYQQIICSDWFRTMTVALIGRKGGSSRNVDALVSELQ